MKTSAKSVLRVYLREAKNYKLLILGSLFALCATVAADSIVPFFYKDFFDLLGSASPSLETGKELIAILFKILILHASSWLGYRIAGFADSYFQPRIMADLKERAFSYLLGHSFSFFANSFGGALVQRLNRLARSFERFFDRMIWDLFPLLARIIVVLVIVWRYDFRAALGVVAFITFMMTANYLLSIWKLKYDTQRAASDSEVTAVMADAITNYNNIQLFNGQIHEAKKFNGVTEKWRKITTFTWRFATVIDALQGAVFVVLEFLIFFFAVRYWQAGTITIGVFVMAQSYFLQIIHRFWDFGRLVRDVYESFADASEMVEILELPYEVTDALSAKKIRVEKAEIEFKDVHFSFNKTREVLKGVNLLIKPGERVAFIGPSGAGKTTIARLLLRLYDLESGSILIDGQDISKITQESLRDSISLVPQDPVLFHRTLFENIHYGRRNAKEKEVYEAAKLAHCDDFIGDLPDGYNTFVGERGVKLSGGERQRVAIARAILKNAPILILDEATSSLDSGSEAMIQDALQNLMKGKTVIAIAHRLSTIKNSDRVIVVEDGKIKEEGSHEELLKKEDSLYLKLWNLQVKGFLPES